MKQILKTCSYGRCNFSLECYWHLGSDGGICGIVEEYFDHLSYGQLLSAVAYIEDPNCLHMFHLTCLLLNPFIEWCDAKSIDVPFKCPVSTCSATFKLSANVTAISLCTYIKMCDEQDLIICESC